jgi:hypothetical protein
VRCDEVRLLEEEYDFRIPLVLVGWDEAGLLEEEYDWIDLMMLLLHLYPKACHTQDKSQFVRNSQKFNVAKLNLMPYWALRHQLGIQFNIDTTTIFGFDEAMITL